MNIDRFGFKAICKSTGTWAFARMAASGFGCYGIRWSDSRAEDYDGCHIYPETLCQCTGIRDSDGRLIYEHDIIEAKDVKGIGFYEKSEILWDGCEWSKKSGIVCSIRGLIDLYEKGEITIRVIGNKFDNK